LQKDKKIRLGYISSDFREHPVADFIEPVLRLHDRNKFQIYCFSLNPKDDSRTTQLKEYADNWELIRNFDLHSKINFIQSKELDILIDLNGMTQGTATQVFNYRLAKAQIGWIGYPFSSPAKQMDYRIVDYNTDPVGLTESFYTEQLVRMPEVFSVFQPNSDLIKTQICKTMPFERNGFVTFGSINNLAKINKDVLYAWAEILNQVPHSRLFFKSPQFQFKETREKVIKAFDSKGIDSSRLDITKHFPSRFEGYKALNEIDICLDSFPYNGTTTTCETLYMGVPVIGIRGAVHRARVTYSQLKALGLEELCADSVDEYIYKAVSLAVDPARLRNIKNTMRGAMENSALMSYGKFVAALESKLLSLLEDTI